MQEEGKQDGKKKSVQEGTFQRTYSLKQKKKKKTPSQKFNLSWRKRVTVSRPQTKSEPDLKSYVFRFQSVNNSVVAPARTGRENRLHRLDSVVKASFMNTR
jgi:hypothetical protein